MSKSRIYAWLARLLMAVAIATGVAPYATAQLYLGEGTWVSDDGIVSGTWRGTIDVAGEDLSGDLTVTGIPGLTEATIDGTCHPGVIDFALIKWESEVATITGTMTESSVAGTFTMPAAVTGTWHGQLTLIPDDLTPTPIVDDSDPAAGTPTPAVEELTAEELAVLASIEEPAPAVATPAPTQPTPAPEVTASPTNSTTQPTPAGTESTPTPPGPESTATPG